ncbi:MAG: PEGA domain-containing protein [Myxococcota bacterium]
MSLPHPTGAVRPSASNRRRIAAALLAMALGALGAETPNAADAQAVSGRVQARFDRAGAALARARRARGNARRRLLESAYEDYRTVLDEVRSKNALYNAAVVANLLARYDEAFAFVQEYMGVEGLSDAERSDGQTLLDGLQPNVAIIDVQSSPEGAAVYVDRLDLAPVGTTPLQVAVPAGEHRVFVRLEHYGDVEERVTANLGEQSQVNARLEPLAVDVRFDVAGPPGTRLFVDGEVNAAMRIALAPGAHVARVESPGREPVEQRFTVAPGTPLRLRLSAASAALPAQLSLRANTHASFYVDGVLVGEGETVEQSVPPGERRVRVVAPGAAGVEQTLSVGPGSRFELSAELTAGERRYGPWPHILAAGTGAAAVSFGALALVARNELNDGNERCTGGATDASCAARRDDLDRANRRADIALGVTGALAITTLILYLTRGRAGRSTIQVEAFGSASSARVGVSGAL